MSFILLGILNSQIDAAGGATYELLETQILTSSAASVTFTGLGSYSDYKHLQMRMTLRSVVSGASFDGIQLRLNGNTGNNYASHQLRGFAGSVSSDATANDSGISLNSCMPANGNPTGVFGAVVADILDFSSTTKNTTVRSLMGAVTANPIVDFSSGVFLNSAAVTSIEVFGRGRNFLAGCRMSLYGIKGG